MASISTRSSGSASRNWWSTPLQPDGLGLEEVVTGATIPSQQPGGLGGILIALSGRMAMTQFSHLAWVAEDVLQRQRRRSFLQVDLNRSRAVPAHFAEVWPQEPRRSLTATGGMPA